MNLLQTILAVLSGGMVGFTLGLIGGGGSILATPLLLYVVGLAPHTAIGTGALAVSVNAFVNFGVHAREGNVRWRSAILFAVTGMAGAAVGSSLGKTFDGKRLLFLFAILMIAVGVMMLRRGPKHGAKPGGEQPAPAASIIRVIVAALAVGALSGFFGIGGGFLIVPGLLVATNMPMLYAVGSSLLAVGTFGLTTAANYALSGLIDWPVAGEYVAGGIVGGLLGIRLAVRLAPQKATLNRVFATLVFVVAVYMLARNVTPFSLGS